MVNMGNNGTVGSLDQHSGIAFYVAGRNDVI